jgi:hypothetical protein
MKNLRAPMNALNPMARRLMKTLAFFGIANLFLYMAVALYLGGDAFNGKIEDGHFYLRNHGTLTEVDETVFIYSRWHSIVTMIAGGVALIAAGFLSRAPKEDDEQ